MSETMVRASGGFSRQNMADEKEAGRLQGINEARVGDAEIYDVLDGKIFTNSSMSGAVGNMPNRGNYNIQLAERRQVATIPNGYHSGSGQITVKDPTARRTLAASETGITSLYPYDYADVDASAVYSAGYAAGKAAAMASGAFELVHYAADHMTTTDTISLAVANTTNVPMDVLITMTAARPRGDGFASPNIATTGGTWLASRDYDIGDTTIQTNIKTQTSLYKVAAGGTLLITLTVRDKAAAVSYTVVKKNG